MKRIKSWTIFIIIIIFLLTFSTILFSAGNIKRIFGSQTWIEGGAAAWTTLSGTTEEYSASIDLSTNGYEGFHLIFEADYDASPTDEVKVKCYGSLNGTNWDDTPVWEIQGDHDTDPQQLSFIVKDLIYVRFGFQQTGSTDSHDVRAAYIPWRWYYE